MSERALASSAAYSDVDDAYAIAAIAADIATVAAIVPLAASDSWLTVISQELPRAQAPDISEHESTLPRGH
jgi:hypothetical protein